MIDLQKAFDTVEHSILENKLKAIGLDGNAIAWFDAYLTNRMQVTDVGGIVSDPRVVPCGVPQGSILGTLLFLIYVNDMEASVSCKLILYADDSALLVSGKYIKIIENVLSDNLLSLSNWLIDNKLSLHLGKTESILFGTKHMLSKHSKLAISCGNNVITSKTFNLSSRHLVYFSGTTMEIRVTRPFIVYFIPGDQYGGPDCFISCLHVLFTEINQIKNTYNTLPVLFSNLLPSSCMVAQISSLLATLLYEN